MRRRDVAIACGVLLLVVGFIGSEWREHRLDQVKAEAEAQGESHLFDWWREGSLVRSVRNYEVRAPRDWTHDDVVLYVTLGLVGGMGGLLVLSRRS